MSTLYFPGRFLPAVNPDLLGPSVESNMLHSFGHLVQQCATCPTMLDLFGQAFSDCRQRQRVFWLVTQSLQKVRDKLKKRLHKRLAEL